MKIRTRLLLIVSALIFLYVAGHLTFWVHERIVATQTARQALERRKLAWRELAGDIRSLIADFKGEVGLEVEDLETGWRLRYNDGRLFPSASIVKVPIMAVCFADYDAGRLALEKDLLVRRKIKTGGSGKLKAAPAGTRVTIGGLVDLMITESDNTATNMLIDFLKFDYLNRSFKTLGLRHTSIIRRMMDFDSRKRGRENYTTAADMAGMLRAMYRLELVSADVSRHCLETLKRQKMRDRIPRLLPADTVVAHKTGLENGVCHDAGIVFTPQGDFLVCALVRHKQKTAHLAKTLIADISREVYDYMIAH